MVMFIFANIGLNGAGVFYNALLPHMGTDDEMDRISNLAFAYGYLGGGILLLLHIGLLILTDYSDPAINFALATSGLWWYGFALLTFKWVPEPPIENEMESLGLVESTKLALREIRKTVSELDKFKTLFVYMLAYFFFIDGINTVTALGGVFGSVVLGITPINLMVTILAIQFVAAPSAVAFTKLAGRIGTKPALSFSLVGWVLLCFGALAFAPLQLDSHDEYQIQYEWDPSSQSYSVLVDKDIPQIAQKLDYETNEFDEQSWATERSHVLPVEVDERYDTKKWFVWQRDSNGTALTRGTQVLLNIGNEEIQGVIDSLSESRFSQCAWPTRWGKCCGCRSLNELGRWDVGQHTPDREGAHGALGVSVGTHPDPAPWALSSADLGTCKDYSDRWFQRPEALNSLASLASLGKLRRSSAHCCMAS